MVLFPTGNKIEVIFLRLRQKEDPLLDFTSNLLAIADFLQAFYLVLLNSWSV